MYGMQSPLHMLPTLLIQMTSCRSTVIFGIFLAVGSFVLGIIRIKKPKLTLPVVGTADTMLCLYVSDTMEDFF